MVLSPSRRVILRDAGLGVKRAGMLMKERCMRMTITQTDAPLTLGLNRATVLSVAFVVLSLLAAPLFGAESAGAEGMPVTQD